MIASDVLKDAVVKRLRTEFIVANVPSLIVIPPIIQSIPKSTLPEPYVFVQVASAFEVDVTKNSSAYDYTLLLEVQTRSLQSNDSKVLRENVAKECVRILEVETEDYINLDNDGFNNYVQTIGEINNFFSAEKGASYSKTIIEVLFRIEFVGLPSTNQPVQDPLFTYTDFLLTPTGTRMEVGDAGSITTSLTYPSNNFGWNYIDGMVIQPFGSDGALVGNVYTVATADANIQLGVTLNYEFGSDNTLTTQLQSTHRWERVRSLRYGSIMAQGGTRPTLTDNVIDTFGINLLSNWVAPNKSIDLDTVDPVGNQITINGQTGEYLYIIFDSTQDDLASIEQDLFGSDVTDRFEAVQTVGNFKIYLSTDPLSYTGDIILDLN